MLRSTLLRRTLVLVLATLLLSALLTLLIYQGVSPRVFAANRSEEMLPKAQLIASLVEHEARGELTWGMLLTLLRNNAAQWDANVWVVNSEGKTLISVQSGKQAYSLPESFQSVVDVVLSGEETTHIGRISALKPADARPRRANSDATKRLFGTEAEATAPPASDTAFPQDADLVLVGVPIRYGEWIAGGVFMAQTMTEVVTGMRSLTNTLLISLLGVTLLMIPIAYIVSRRLARPIKQMRDVALAMAGGDFSARADTETRGEIGELGGALNHLSGELGSTISQLMVERTRLRRILNGLSEGIVAVDAQGKITHVNPAMRTLFRRDARPDGGEAERLAIVPEQEVWAAYEAVLTGGAPEVRTVRDGEASLRVSISPLEDEEGRIVGAVGVFRDVTQSERLEQTRRDYVANVSHELRTPLTALRALIEPLRDGLVQGEADRDRLYGVMLRETLRLSRLVNDMLELSRLQSGALSLEKYAFDPAHMLRDVYAKYAAHVEDHGQTLILTLPEAGFGAVLGNHDRTEQVLITLLDNAIKYTPEGGRIEIIAEPETDALRISVRDSGTGIAAADLPHVFDRFYKADKAHQGNGTGLGLAIAREILTRLGEQISVSSREGEGSTFTFTLHWDEPNP